MSDDENDLPPMVDLASFRLGRESAKQDAEDEKSYLDASIEEGQLWLHHPLMGKYKIGFGARHIAWLEAWIAKWHVAERERIRGPDEHRCRRCGKVKYIECRGHRVWGEMRTHYVTKVLDTRTTTVYMEGGQQQRTYVIKAHTACGRISSGDLSETWDKVDCFHCLKRKPRAV